LHRDFSDMLSALNDSGAEYLVVGAYAMAFHGYVRATADIDIWLRPTPENAHRVWGALATFGAPTTHLIESDLHAPDMVYQFGVAPFRIDLLTGIDGVDFDEAWSQRQQIVAAGLPINVLAKELLIRNKLASGRPKDATDVVWLQQPPPAKD
jgi:hypothetical protein